MQALNLQPTTLANDMVQLVPLQTSDFEALYKVASDPLIWEQHPNPDRYQKEIFEIYFKGAIESKGAMLIKKTNTQEVIGCSRFYNYDAQKKMMHIGYTFFARYCWAKGFNRAVKTLMIEYAWQFVDTIVFQVGAHNYRSQIAIQKLGATKIGTEAVAYYGEATHENYIYSITKENWKS